MLIYIKLAYLHKIVYSYWANRWRSRWDTTDAAVESVHSDEFPLHHNADSFCAIWNRNQDITKFLRVLLACDKCYAQIEYPFYHGNYWQTDWPSALRHRITSKDATDTFIEQVELTDAPDSSGKARRKRIVYRYMYMLMNNLIDFYPALWVTNPFPTWP
jgi:hypothetical protein